ncbi:hypothetical protein KOI35_03520 [Actinoplanes bogorensis]|uniref:Glucosamine kinase n=1 Tax=Paractinoplanes bogorensis TaxID=1610840 RepID=A0ABS5YGU2_9ACTN|nr:hypothetical protein [Actinoplanes bogorensis]MBU2662566.1 hypothetical protein [Actinoplanes bogorensis]
MSGESAELVRRVIARDPRLQLFVSINDDISLDERPITVDQTNRSVVVGERLVVKWMRTPAPDRSTPLLAHLAANGFRRMPTPHAALFDGPNLVALVTEFLPDGQDGYDWCVDDLLAALDGGPPANFGADLGTLVAELHIALATPSHVMPHPIEPAPPADGWSDLLDEALATSSPAPAAGGTPATSNPAPATSSNNMSANHDGKAAPTSSDAAAAISDNTAPTSGNATAATSGGELDGSDWLAISGYEAPGENWPATVRARLAADLDSPARRRPGRAIHLHGDLHVGQILRWRGGYAVIDFDGNPTLAARPEPVARDVAQLRMSVLHVAEIANKRTAGRHRAELVEWGRRTADELLTAYGKGLASKGFDSLLDRELLRPFEVEQECRELVYAARFLPRWRYAPLGVLRSWYG